MEVLSDRIHARELFEKNSSSVLNELLRNASVMTFVYYPKLKFYEFANIPASFGSLPMSGGNYPECIFEYIPMAEKHREIYRQAVKQIDEGAKEVEFTLEVFPGGNALWVTIHFTNVFDSEGKPDYALAYGYNTTVEKVKERDLAEQMLLSQAAQSTLMKASCFNVSKDIIVKRNGEDNFKIPDSEPCTEEMKRLIFEDEPDAIKQNPETLYVFLSAVSQIPDPAERKRFAHLASHKGLLEAYLAGKTEQTIEYTRVVDGKEYYVSTKIVLMSDPVTSDVFAFFYSTDLTDQRNDNLVIDTVMHESCDFIAIVDAHTDTASFRFMSKKMKMIAPRWASGDKVKYEEELFPVIRATVEKEEAERLLERTTCEFILKEMLENDTLTNIFDVYEGESLRHKNVTYRWLRGKGNEILVIQQDVTEARELEIARMKKAAEEDVILSQIAFNVLDFVAIVDIEKRQFILKSGTWYNKGMETLPEDRIVSYDGLIEKIGYLYFPNIIDRKEFIRAFDLDEIVEGLETGDEHAIVYDFTGASGAVQRKQFSYSWLSKEDKKLIVIRTDITQTYLKDQKLQKALEDAERANDSKNDFISRISHDIRTPLAAVHSMTEFALEDMDDKEKLQHDLKQIQSSASFLASIINDILDVSKIDSGQVTLRFEPYSYRGFHEDFDDMIRAAAADKGIGLRIEKREDENLTVLADPVRWRQVVLNIAMNAIRYTPTGGIVTVKTDWTVGDDDTADCLIYVEDNGIGMTEEFQKHIFEPFKQDENNPSRRAISGGTGLGLYIVKRIVEMMNGTISIESRVYEGTKVTIHIPAKLQKAEGEKDKDKAQKAADIHISGHVLLAEDNLINKEIALRLLGAIGLTVDWAGDGKEALDKFEGSAPNAYDAVLMDIQMPLMNGYESTKAIRELDRADAKTVPIIAMTADAFDSAKERAFEAGINEFITKPLNTAQVRQTLLNYIGGKEA